MKFVDPNGMLEDWYQNDEGQLLWKSGTEKDGVEFNGEQYKWKASDGEKLGTEGATLIVSGHKFNDGDMPQTFDRNAKQMADGVNNSGGNAVIAVAESGEEFIDAFEQTTSSFGQVNDAVVRSHGDMDYGVVLGVGGISFEPDDISTFAGKIEDGSIKFKFNATVAFLGCGMAAGGFTEAFTEQTRVRSVGAYGTVGASNPKGMYNTGKTGNWSITYPVRWRNGSILTYEVEYGRFYDAVTKQFK